MTTDDDRQSARVWRTASEPSDRERCASLCSRAYSVALLVSGQGFGSGRTPMPRCSLAGVSSPVAARVGGKVVQS